MLEGITIEDGGLDEEITLDALLKPAEYVQSVPKRTSLLTGLQSMAVPTEPFARINLSSSDGGNDDDGTSASNKRSRLEPLQDK